MDETVELTIEGKPGTSVTIVPRDRGDRPPPPEFEGKIGVDGIVIARLRRAYYVVLSPGADTLPLHLDEGPASQRIVLS